MKTDRYTKIVLTVIACALSILVFQNAFEIKSANASAKVNKVAICDTSGKYCADVDSYTRESSGIDLGNRLSIISTRE